jgi:hypothetical protein
VIILEENLEILEMNEYEKMSNELIEEKEKVKFDFDNWLFSSFLVITVLFTGLIIFIFIDKKMLFEHLLVFAIFGVFLSSFLALIFTFVVEFSLKIKRKINFKNDREYQLAKEVIRNYEKKVSEFNKKKFFENKRKNCKEILDKEVEKSKRISKLENYLRNERKRS